MKLAYPEAAVPSTIWSSPRGGDAGENGHAMKRAAVLLVPLLLLAGSCGHASAVEHRNRGLELVEEGRWKEAVAEFDKAIELNPKLFSAYNGRGVAYLELESYKRALENLDKANELAPNQPFILNNRGVAYLGLKQPEQALSEIVRVFVLRVHRTKPMSCGRHSITHAGCEPGGPVTPGLERGIRRLPPPTSTGEPRTLLAAS